MVALLEMAAVGCRLLEAEEGLALICKGGSAATAVVETLPVVACEDMAGSPPSASEPVVWFEFDVGIDVKVDGGDSRVKLPNSDSLDKVAA